MNKNIDFTFKTHYYTVFLAKTCWIQRENNPDQLPGQHYFIFSCHL